MCGISGILNRKSCSPVTKQLVSTMNDQMVHRGPDADGVFVEGNIGLGHRRLKIIDLAGGVQPMFSADRQIVTVFNGEIYNFKELKKQLEVKGHQFSTHSDTEIIISAYLEYGDECVNYFNGMFGIAIYDKSNQKLLIFRDRLGIKPVYYFIDEDRFIFSSEIKPILSVLPGTRDIRLDSLDFYMSVGYVPGSDTLFEGIKKLPAGHSLCFQNNRYSINKYWDLPDKPQANISFNDAQEGLESLLQKSVKYRLASDVPLGAFLSGGLDSSIIVGLMDQLSDTQIKTFSVGYKDDPKTSELEFAKIVARHFNTEHHEFILESGNFFDSIDTLLEHTEEPIIESAAVALFQLSKLAKEHVTVILSGEGADEILAGYPLHQIMPTVEKIHGMVRYLPDPIKSLGSYLVKNNEKLSKYWDWSKLPYESRYQSISNDITHSLKTNLYSDPQMFPLSTTSDYYQGLYQRQTNGSDLQKMIYTDIKSWLPDDLLLKADKMTMAASLELRVPFLDHELVEFATSLPDEYRINNKQGKYLLKRFAEGLLPNEIIYRKKRGFPVPIQSWFKNDLYEQTAEILLDPSTLQRGYFNSRYVENILARHRKGKEDHSRRIFSLLNLEMWHRKYLV